MERICATRGAWSAKRLAACAFSPASAPACTVSGKNERSGTKGNLVPSLQNSGSALHTSRSGSALLLVFWALIVLSGAILAWVKITQQGIRLSNEAGRGLEARAMAHSGIAVVESPQVSKLTPLLEEAFAADIGYRVRMVSEGGKLNLKVMLHGEDPAKVAIVERWLESRGLGYPERRRFIDCYYDYTDTDGESHRLNGMEDEGDYVTPDKEISSIDEIALIAGSEPLTSTPGWKDEITVESQGPIDLLAASPDILRLIPGFGEGRIQQLLLLRRGRDGVDGTLDDPPFKEDLATFLRRLGLQATPPQLNELAKIVTINDPMMRIISEGRSGTVIRQVEVVAVKNGPVFQIKSWKE